jgi:hypothetical protein
MLQMALVAVLMLATLTVGATGKPVPGDWDHEINVGQNTYSQHTVQQNTDSDEFQQTENLYTQQGKNQEFEDFQQSQNQQDIEQIGQQHQDTQQGQNQEFEDFQQNQNEQDIEQVQHQHQDIDQYENEQEIKQSGQFHQTPNEQEFQQVGQNENDEQFQQSQHHEDIEQVGQNHENFGLTQQNDDEINQLLGSDKYGEQQHDRNPAVEPVVSEQHYKELGFEFVPTEKPIWWKRLGNKISETYKKAKDKTHEIANKIKETVG